MLHGQGWVWGSTQGTALHGTLWWAEGRCSNLEAAPQSSVQDRTPLGHLGQRGRDVCIKGPSEPQPGDSGFELSFLSGAASCPPRLPFIREPLTHGARKVLCPLWSPAGRAAPWPSSAFQEAWVHRPPPKLPPRSGYSSPVCPHLRACSFGCVLSLLFLQSRAHSWSQRGRTDGSECTHVPVTFNFTMERRKCSVLG